MESCARSTRCARASSSSRSSGPSQAPSRSAGAPALPTAARRAATKASARSGSGIIVERPDLEPQRRPAGAQRQDGPPGRPVGRPEAHPERPGSCRRGWPGPGTGSSTTPRSAWVVPQCAQSQARVSGCSGPSRSSRSGTGSSRCRSSGQARLAAARSATRRCRASAASRSWPARMRQPSRLRLRRCGAGGTASRWNQSSAAGPRSCCPGDHPGAGRRGAEGRDLGRRSGDPQVVVEPVRMRQRQHLGAPAPPPLPRPAPPSRASQVEQLGRRCRSPAWPGGHSRAWSSGRGGGCGPSPARRGRRPGRPR